MPLLPDHRFYMLARSLWALTGVRCESTPFVLYSKIKDSCTSHETVWEEVEATKKERSDIEKEKKTEDERIKKEIRRIGRKRP